MQCSMKKYMNKALQQDEFINDFFDEIRKKPIAAAHENNIEYINHEKYQKTITNPEYNLFIPEKSTTEITVYYTMRNYHCTCGRHKPKERIAFLFGAKHHQGHIFGICNSCLLKLSLILLKYYKFGKVYTYTQSATIRLEKAYNIVNCYTCRNSGTEEYYRLKFYNHTLFLCKACLDKFVEEILTTPTVKTLYPDITHEFEKSKRERKKKHKK